MGSPWVPYGFPWVPHGFPMGSLWVPYGFPVGSLWVPCGFPVGSLRVPYGFPTGSLWVPHGNPREPMGTHGNPREPAGTHGNPREPTGIRGKPDFSFGGLGRKITRQLCKGGLVDFWRDPKNGNPREHTSVPRISAPDRTSPLQHPLGPHSAYAVWGNTQKHK